MELMHGSENFEVDFYFSQKIIKTLNENHSNVFLSEPTELLSQFNSKKYDLIIIGTAHRYFNLFEKISETYNTAVVVHNINFSKISKGQLFRNIFKKDFQYRLKLLLKEDLLSAPDVYQKAKNLFVLDESMANDILKFLPVFYNKFSSKNHSEHLKIVIPGAVSQKRRDYQSVLQKLKNFKNKTEVVFLGKASGKELKWLQDFKSEHVKLKFFTEKVPQNIFDDEMNNADVLWCPVQKKTDFFSNEEIYGETKMSGNIGDAVKYGKTAIFPKDFHSELSFIKNEEKDIENQFLKLSQPFDFQYDFNFFKVKNQLEDALKDCL